MLLIFKKKILIGLCFTVYDRTLLRCSWWSWSHCYSQSHSDRVAPSFHKPICMLFIFFIIFLKIILQLFLIFLILCFCNVEPGARSRIWHRCKYKTATRNQRWWVWIFFILESCGPHLSDWLRLMSMRQELQFFLSLPEKVQKTS